MIELAGFAGRHALELMAATLLVAACIAYGAVQVGRARMPTFDAAIRVGVVVIVIAAACFAARTTAR